MDRLKIIRAQTVLRRNTLAMATIFFTLFMVGSTTAYAFFQVQGDPGLQFVSDEGLVTPLALSQTTAEGITIEIPQGYADANRIAFWINISGLDPAQRYFFDGRLYRGEDHSQWFGNGGSGGMMESGAAPGSMQGILTYDITEPIPESGVFDLYFELRVNGMPETTGDGLMLETPIASAGFEVSLSPLAAVELAPNMEVSNNGVNVRLETLEITPSQTNATVCYAMPSAQDWHPNVMLTIDDQSALPSSAGAAEGDEGFALDAPERCVNLGFLVPYSDTSERLVLTIDRLQTSPSEILDSALVSERLAAQGIVVEFYTLDHGMGYNVISAPEGMTDADIGMAVYESQQEHFPGNWRFEVTLP